MSLNRQVVRSEMMTIWKIARLSTLELETLVDFGALCASSHVRGLSWSGRPELSPLLLASCRHVCNGKVFHDSKDPTKALGLNLSEVPVH